MKLPYRDYAQAKDFTCLGTWCLLFGPEHHLKREALARMRAEVSAGGEEPSWEVLDGPALTARDLLGRCQTGALFGGPRVIVVQAADRIPAPEQDHLVKEVGPLLPGVSVILVTAETGERRSARALRPRLQRALEQAGLAIEFPSMKVAQAAAWAVDRAKLWGKKLAPAAARKLAEQKVGTGLAEIESEVEKLCLFVGEAPVITTADVDTVTPQLVEEDVWGLVEAVGKRSPARAVRILRSRLADRREEPQRLLALLAQSLRVIWQTKLLLERGWRPGSTGPAQPDHASRRAGSQPAQVDDEIASLLPQDPRKNVLAVFARRPWLARRTMPQAAAFSWEQLAQAMRALLACDLALKGIQGKVTDPALALELLVIQLCTDVAMPIWQTPAGERRLG